MATASTPHAVQCKPRVASGTVQTAGPRRSPHGSAAVWFGGSLPLSGPQFLSLQNKGDRLDASASL